MNYNLQDLVTIKATGIQGQIRGKACGSPVRYDVKTLDGLVMNLTNKELDVCSI